MPNLGLGYGLAKSGMPVASHVTDNLKMLHRYNTGSVVPVSDGAAYFDAANNNYVAIGNQSNLSFGTGSFSVACWVLTTQTGTTSFILGKGSSTSTASSVGYALYFGNSGTDWVFSVGDGTDYALAQTNSLPTRNTNQWYHVCGTWDGSTKTAKIYQDGVLIDTDTDTDVGDIDNSDAFDIGRLDASTSNDWTGYVCNAGVWSGVLTQAQIKSIMWKNYAGLTDSEKTNLVSWWNLDSLTEFDSVGTDDGLVLDNHDTTVGSELLTGFTNGSSYPFDTFTSSGRDISAAIETSGDWGGCVSNVINATAGEWYKCTFDLTYNSGSDHVRIALVNGPSGGATHRSNDAFTSTNGANTVYLKVATTDSSSYLQIGTGESADVINFSMSNISLKKMNGNHGEMK